MRLTEGDAFEPRKTKGSEDGEMDQVNEKPVYEVNKLTFLANEQDGPSTKKVDTSSTVISSPHDDAYIKSKLILDEAIQHSHGIVDFQFDFSFDNDSLDFTVDLKEVADSFLTSHVSSESFSANQMAFSPFEEGKQTTFRRSHEVFKKLKRFFVTKPIAAQLESPSPLNEERTRSVPIKEQPLDASSLNEDSQTIKFKKFADMLVYTSSPKEPRRLLSFKHSVFKPKGRIVSILKNKVNSNFEIESERTLREEAVDVDKYLVDFEQAESTKYLQEANLTFLRVEQLKNYYRDW